VPLRGCVGDDGIIQPIPTCGRSAEASCDNFIEKASRLYEQKRRTAVSAASPLEMYVRRWLRWAGRELIDLGERKSRLAAAFRFIPRDKFRPQPFVYYVAGLQ
jgi:hypothetical protein